MQEKIRKLINKSGFPLTAKDWEKLIIHDFGLGDFKNEGAAFIDILLSEQLRITLLVLLPNQTLPEHKHPIRGNNRGKEETIRALYGQIKIYVEGIENSPHHRIPKNKNLSYTAKYEICLQAGEQYTILPEARHWFQAGPEGSVNLAFQNRFDETQNIFTDPKSIGCKIT